MTQVGCKVKESIVRPKSGNLESKIVALVEYIDTLSTSCRCMSKEIEQGGLLPYTEDIEGARNEEALYGQNKRKLWWRLKGIKNKLGTMREITHNVQSSLEQKTRKHVLREIPRTVTHLELQKKVQNAMVKLSSCEK